MKIQSIQQTQIRTKYNTKNSNKLSFKAITLPNISDKYIYLSESLKKETQTFVKHGTNAKLLGSGLFSEVFNFKNLKNIVLKRSFAKDNFLQEMEALKSIPETLYGTQKFVARAYDDDTNKYYLLSTKIEGESPDPHCNPWEDASLRNLFDGMYEMDKIGLYHGDLNNGNIKIDGNHNVNFLDFQWGTKASSIRFFEKNPTQCMPDFMLMQNAQMFEMAEIPYYLKSMGFLSSGKNFMKTYLQKKSKYHTARVNYIETLRRNWPYSSELPIIKKGIDFENAQAHIYKNPTEKIVKLETLKIQFLSAFRETSKYLDPNTPHKNILTAPSSYLVTLSKLQAFRKEIARQKENYTNDSYTEKYLDGMEEYADYWYDNICSWSQSAFSYVKRQAESRLLANEECHNFEDPQINIEVFKPITDIVAKVDSSFNPTYTSNFSTKTYYTEFHLRNIGRIITNIPSNDIKTTYNKLKQAYDNNRGLDVINQALLLARRAEECIDNIFSIEKNHEASCIIAEESLSVKSDATTLASEAFDTIFREITQSGSKDCTFFGYNKMEIFQ